MEWNYEESLKGIAKASVENWKALKDGVCVVCGSKDAGNGQEATAAYREYCFSYGTPGRLYYNDQKAKADRVKDPTPGSLCYMLKVYG